ncbi:MAG: hypothetical protein GC181_09045 [Bacteroidetes bacterium]|nr:hypothetical protein [Bacteroidota bacterium]
MVCKISDAFKHLFFLEMIGDLMVRSWFHAETQEIGNYKFGCSGFIKTYFNGEEGRVSRVARERALHFG